MTPSAEAAHRPAAANADSRPALSLLRGAEITSLLASLGQPAWRSRQLEKAVWQPYLRSFSDIRQLSPGLREQLDGRLRFSTLTVPSLTVADAGRTIKLLCGLDGGETVETVAMETPALGASRRRATVCVSTQVGCAVGCPFCATGMLGLRRSCTAAEIVDQVRAAAGALHGAGLGPVTHVVYMGMGEPLHAYTSTAASLRILHESAGISPRRITVSTSGVAPGIERLAAEARPVNLALSLHAATDELRDRLVPINRAYPLGRLLPAAGRYAGSTGRRLTLEWCLIGGVNDAAEQAAELARIAATLRAHVNVIPMNRIAGSPWGPPPARVARAFLRRLVEAGTTVTVRDTRGADAEAACGQLRAALEPRRHLREDGTLSPPAPARSRR